MTDKREHPRQNCNIRVKFDILGDFDSQSLKPAIGKGHILDISRGGAFIVSNSRVLISVPIKLYFKMNKTKYIIDGIIVRTGLLANNPSEIAKRLANKKAKGDSYIAVKFDTTFDI
ncbi:MAG: PilZ domain-containing protein [Spirochaetota bacterium]|nr:PilZ domain-containing protein [Spirochaetota bacterium]